MKLHTFCSTLILVLVLAASSFAQETPGILQFANGDYKKAVSTLKNEIKKDRKNARLWNFLGMAYDKRKKLKDARNSFLTAVGLDSTNPNYLTNLSYASLKLGMWRLAEREAGAALVLEPGNVTAFSNRSLARLKDDRPDEALPDALEVVKRDPGNYAGYFLASEILLSKHTKPGTSKKERLEYLQASSTLLEKCVEVCVAEKEMIAERAKEQLEFLEYLLAEAKLGDADFAECVPMRVLFKSLPAYPSSARNTSVVGTLRLRVVFRSDGNIGPIIALNTLPGGLTEAAIAAAKRIKFAPETCKDVPVSVTKTIVYTFSIY